MAVALHRLLAALAALLDTLLRRCFALLLRCCGPVPRHVAFVMDGNRRYAERQGVDRTTGHTHGYSKMVEVIHWCIELGVTHITVYAFSIDNFRRSEGEVGALMQLAEDKYAELARDKGLAEREGIEMHIVGDLTLPPPAVQGAAARLMRRTAAIGRKRATLNVCFSYTSSEETVAAVAALQAAVRGGVLQPDDLTPAALAGSLRTRPACPPVDLLLRTSGEARLSDFLLWQASHAQLVYLDAMWPDLGWTDWARAVLQYQRRAAPLAALRRAAEERIVARAAAAQQAGARGQAEAGAEASAGRGGTESASSAGEGAAGVAWREEAGAESGSCWSGRACGGSQGCGWGAWAESAWLGRCRWLLAWMREGGRSCLRQRTASGCGSADPASQQRLRRYLEEEERARAAWVASHAHL